MTTTWTDCIVHNWKYFSQFYGNLNKIRQTKQFSVSILQQLQKRCCSCGGQTGESSFDLDDLRKLCHEIQSLEESQPIPIDPTSIPYVVLQFPSTLSLNEHIYKTGCFIGRGGKQLQLFERQFNVRINIVNEKSREHFRQIVDQLKQQNKQKYDKNALWILITIKKNSDNEKNHIEKVKQALQNRWKQLDVIIKTNKLIKEELSREEIIDEDSLYIDGDTRWKPKK